VLDSLPSLPDEPFSLDDSPPWSMNLTLIISIYFKAERHEVPFKAYKPKPFTEVVKIQRPEVTRQKPRGKPESYADRLASMSKTTTIKKPSTSDLKEKERLYGECFTFFERSYVNVHGEN
jgi:hypothetical protein